MENVYIFLSFRHTVHFSKEQFIRLKSFGTIFCVKIVPQEIVTFFANQNYFTVDIFLIFYHFIPLL